MPNDIPDSPIHSITGIGPHRAKILKRLGIATIRDALYYLPYRYEDRRALKKISQLTYGTVETVMGKVVSSHVRRTRGKNFRIFELVINDGSALLTGKWFNQPFLRKTFALGSTVLLRGTIKKNPYYGIGFEIDNPEYEIVGDEDDVSIHMNRIVPVYRVTDGLSVRQMRSIIFRIISTRVSDIIDPIPNSTREKFRLADLRVSLKQVHFPDDGVDVDLLNKSESPFHRRLAFDELFLMQIGLALMKKYTLSARGIAFSPSRRLIDAFLTALPFRLTGSQERVFDAIHGDMMRACPMNRLIQGDVGCGKTIIAVMAMLTAAESGYQSALMAPTEILAEQHYLTLYPMMERLGLSICLLTGSSRDRPLDQISSGKLDIIVGTHSLIQERIAFGNLGLVIVDEQHRFGIMQRLRLRQKGAHPDVLVMTATPIPRTLALTLYGDFDCSVIDELPPGRQSIKTLLYGADQKESVYRIITQEVNMGRQVYVVYPAIEESDKTDLRSAITGKKAFERIFPDLRIGLLHGRMKTQEREGIMASFKRGDIDILVCTTVIEVGVDVPNASLMIIIHAERFGLSQLHQLRGRIGRGPYQSYCILLAYAPYSREAGRRLDIMVKSNDGFKIAEEDLQIRGPGEFFGLRQSGMPDLRVADIIRDTRILAHARQEAFAVIEDDPQLERYPPLRNSVETFWKGKTELFQTR